MLVEFTHPSTRERVAVDERRIAFVYKSNTTENVTTIVLAYEHGIAEFDVAEDYAEVVRRVNAASRAFLPGTTRPC